MPKLFSVLSWNVEHFKDDPTPTRVKKVVDFMKLQNPDVFGIFEVEGKTIFDALVSRMPDFTFQITEGEQTQEILVGVRKTLTAFITQKTEFRSGTTHMRPGQLVTIVKGGVNYAILFLHLASGPDPRGMGLRDDMIERAFDFRKTLDKAEGGEGKAHYIFLGDLNTMGLEYPFNKDIDAVTELKKADKHGQRAKIQMARLVKTHDVTWSNGTTSSLPPSNLDHVYASSNLQFSTFVRPSDQLPANVSVRGWVDLDTAAKKDKFIKELSDHSLLFFEVRN
jgi:endonuclease/exonuclease/phosphatase family metal-dependent hydrolase